MGAHHLCVNDATVYTRDFTTQPFRHGTIIDFTVLNTLKERALVTGWVKNNPHNIIRAYKGSEHVGGYTRADLYNYTTALDNRLICVVFRCFQ